MRNQDLDFASNGNRDREYILEDLLEITCLLTPTERNVLLSELRNHDTMADAVNIHPAFSLSRRAVVVMQDRDIEECWIFYPKQKRISKHFAAQK